MTELTLEEMTLNILEEAGVPLTAREIAIRIADKYPDYKEEKTKKTTQENFSFENQVASEIYKRKIHNPFKKLGILFTGDKPQKFYLAKWDTNKEIPVANIIPTIINSSNSIKEKDLYQPLINYFKITDNIYAMRVNEATSKNIKGQNGNKWLHPDIVGIKDTFAKKIDDDRIKTLASNTDSNQFKLYSYEVKKEITINDARECFFQTLSNSTWANYSYLVCTSFKDDDVREELKMLCESFGVGLLRVSLDSSSSEILDDECEEVVPSKEKSIDIMLLNRLAKTNSDFNDYVSKVNDCYQLKRITGF